MRQIVQNLGSGKTTLVDTPAPKFSEKHVIIQNHASLVSLGTERMLVEFGQASLIEKARKQPDKVKMVLEKVGTDGLSSTIDTVRSKLNQPITMGYCAAGVVLNASDSEFSIGDRVVSNAPHAEVSCVPRNLVAHIPDGVSFEQAAFTPVAAIGLQGIRLVAPQLGETVVVMGLGLIGLLVMQMLVAQGCHVIGLDFDDAKLRLAEEFGAVVHKLDGKSNPVSSVVALNDGNDVDAVIVTASTASSDPMTHAAQMLRKRGRIVLVGVTGLNLSRADFYEKELTFQVSCSYGPGRYDEEYEQKGNDYPIGFVRWTEKRNFEAVLKMLSKVTIDVSKLITSRHPFADAESVYQGLSDNKNALGVILEYDATQSVDTLLKSSVILRETPVNGAAGSVVAGVIGAGNYASRILIPAMKKAGISLGTVVSSGGVSAAHHGQVNGFDIASSDAQAVFENTDINLAVIATRHDTHAKFVCDSLKAGKHVFVEKPLGITHAELETVEETWNGLGDESSQQVMVGFNRRFAPQVITMKKLLDTVAEPKCFNFMMNAGSIPADSWVQSNESGGGRIIGEACHHIDLMRFLVGDKIVSVQAKGIGRADGSGVTEDKAAILLGFADGSVGTIHYYANGDKGFSKERFEAFAAGSILQLDNFRKLTGYGWPGFKKQNLMKQDKGQEACIAAFAEAIGAGKPSPISMEELMEVSRATIDAAEMIRAG